MIYLERNDIVFGGAIACGFSLIAADEGLLQSTVTRPQTSAFGADAYPAIWDKAAALLYSLARNYPFVDGNKRTAWAATWVFLRLNSVDLPGVYDADFAERLLVDAAMGELAWPEIGEALQHIGE